LKRARDMAQVNEKEHVDVPILEEAFALLEIDHMGLDEMDRQLLLTLIEKHKGGPVGVETLAATLSEDMGTIEDVIEPYLMQIGFLRRTPRGREATEKAYLHMKIRLPVHSDQQSIF